MSSVSQQGLCTTNGLKTRSRECWHWCFAFSHMMFELVSSQKLKGLTLLCAPSYCCFLLIFTWLKSSRRCFSDHVLFTRAPMQCVGWECADVYRGLRCEISSEASSVSQIRNRLGRSLYLLVYQSRLPEHDVQNINQWVRMRLFINGANVRIMQRSLECQTL